MKTLVALAFTMFLVRSFAQTKIEGSVADNDGKVISGANVFVAGTYDGTSTNENGEFEFETMEIGKKLLVIRFVGYKEFIQPVELVGTRIAIAIKLDEEINELEAVVISAGAFAASDVSRRTVFRAVDIATTAGATADIAGALNTLPGTQKVGESGRLFVRGGDGNETRSFIDGLVVLDAYSPSAPNTPSRGRFLPFMFSGISFSTGGYSAEYGQALSSVLVLDSKDKADLTRTDFGVLSVGGDVGHTQVWDKGSVGGKIQYTNLRPYVELINQEIDWDKAPVSIEGSGAFRHKVGRDGIFKFYGNFSRSNFSLHQHHIDDYNNSQLFDLTNSYQYINGFYKNYINDDWMVRGGVSYTSLTTATRIEEKTVREAQRGVHFKTVAEGSVSDNVELKAGGEATVRFYDKIIAGQVVPASYSFEEVIPAAFVEANIYASNQFVVRIGGRAEFNNLISRVSLDPRVSLAYKLGAQGQASFAYGKFRQSPNDKFVMIRPELEPEKADHYILNYQYANANKTFRIEAYYKEYSDLIKSNDFVGLTNSGSGHAKGIEMFWRDNASIKHLDYWISYSFLDTKRDYLDFPHEAVPAFASKHNFSLVTKYFVRTIKSQLGFTYSFTSGRPYNNPNVEGFHVLTTPNYSDLSFNWSYLPSAAVIIYFSCTNLLGRDNVFGFEYSTVRSQNGLYNGRAIRQPATRFVFLGIFITLSKDKSVNQLPNL
jgi:hypothetical protein